MQTTEKVVDIKKPKKVVKPKIEAVTAPMIVDVWRLIEKHLIHQVYPDISEEQPEVIRSWLFQYLQKPRFAGLIAKIGKRPIGLILGDVRQRPYGKPLIFVNIEHFFVDPAFRKQGVGKTLRAEYTIRMNKAGVFYYEGFSEQDKGKVLYLAGGKL